MKKILSAVLIIVSVFAFQGCYYDKEELVYPPNTNTCDTLGMTYTKDIRSIMVANCNSCHAAPAGAGGGIVLDNYAQLKLYADAGNLVNRLITTDASLLMPKGGPKLSDCNIAKIQAWVNAGAPN